jgi:hypothetical protein
MSVCPRHKIIRTAHSNAYLFRPLLMCWAHKRQKQLDAVLKTGVRFTLVTGTILFTTTFREALGPTRNIDQ